MSRSITESAAPPGLGCPEHLLPPDRRLRQYQSGKRQCVVVIRERDGVTLPGVFKSEGEALDFIRRKIARGTEVHADESGAWNPHRLCRETTKQSVLLYAACRCRRIGPTITRAANILTAFVI